MERIEALPRTGPRFAGVLLLCLLAAAATAQADAPLDDGAEADPAELYEGWYVVRPGDTLEDITQRYLGDSQRWRENWRLNPEVRNPHLLAPGQRLRILVRSVPDDGALLTRKSNRVEDQLPPLAWQDARLLDVLRPRDSVRTFERSSAELRFGDETSLVLSEESLVFLDREVLPGAAPVTKDQVEIVLGQADLGGRGRNRAGEAIELVIGDAVAVPEASDAGRVQARARKAESSAQLMAYEGGSSLASGGVEIEVPQGMGSAVPEGAPPGPPEKLLPAPELATPTAGARLATPRPDFRWASVDGAAAYVAEVCGDPDCVLLVARASMASTTGVAQRWQPATQLPVADLYWRVSAVSPSGLDGYAAQTRALAILSDAEDTTPPRVSFRVAGPHLPPRTGLNATWILGTEARLEAVAEDADSGVDRIEHRLDGAAVTVEAWTGPWPTGAHQASFTAFDGAGNSAELPVVPFVYDTAAPALSWGIGHAGFRGRIDAASEILPAGEDSEAAPWSPARASYSIRDPHSFWPWRKQIWTVRHDGRQLTLTPNRPVLLVVEGGTTDELSVVLGPERGLWVLAEDAACGPSLRMGYELDLRLARGGSGRHGELTLHLVADDASAHRATAEFKLTTAKADREARARLQSEAQGEGAP